MAINGYGGQGLPPYIPNRSLSEHSLEKPKDSTGALSIIFRGHTIEEAQSKKQGFSHGIDEIYFGLKHDDDCGIRFSQLIARLKKKAERFIVSHFDSNLKRASEIAKVAKLELETHFPKNPSIHFLGAFQLVILLPEEIRNLVWHELKSCMDLMTFPKEKKTFSALFHTLLLPSKNVEETNFGIDPLYSILNIIGMLHLSASTEFHHTSGQQEGLNIATVQGKTYLLIHISLEKEALTLHLPLDATEALVILNEKIQKAFDLTDSETLAQLIDRLSPKLTEIWLSSPYLREELEAIGFNAREWEKAALHLINSVDTTLCLLGMRLIFLKSLTDKVEHSENSLVLSLPKIMTILTPEERSGFIFYFRRTVERSFGNGFAYGLLDLIGENYTHNKFIEGLIETVARLPDQYPLALELFYEYIDPSHANFIKIGLMLFQSLKTEPELIAGLRVLTRLSQRKNVSKEHLIRFYAAAKIIFSKQELLNLSRDLFTRMHRTITCLLEGNFLEEHVENRDYIEKLSKHLLWLCRNLCNQKHYLEADEILSNSLRLGYLSLMQKETTATCLTLCEAVEKSLEGKEAGNFWLRYVEILQSQLSVASKESKDNEVSLTAQQFCKKIKLHLGLIEAGEVFLQFDNLGVWQKLNDSVFLAELARELKEFSVDGLEIKSRVTKFKVTDSYLIQLKQGLYYSCLKTGLSKDEWQPLHGELFEQLSQVVALDPEKTSWELVERNKHHLTKEDLLYLYRQTFDLSTCWQDKQTFLRKILRETLAPEITHMIRQFSTRLAYTLISNNEIVALVELLENLAEYKIELNEIEIILEALKGSLKSYNRDHSKFLETALITVVDHITNKEEPLLPTIFQESLWLIFEAFRSLSRFQKPFIKEFKRKVPALLSKLQKRDDIATMESLLELMMSLNHFKNVPSNLNPFVIYLIERIGTSERVDHEKIEFWLEKVQASQIAFDASENLFSIVSNLFLTYAVEKKREKVLCWIDKLHSIGRCILIPSEPLKNLEQMQRDLIDEEKYEEAETITDFLLRNTPYSLDTQKLLDYLLEKHRSKESSKRFFSLALKYLSLIAHSPLYATIQQWGCECITRSIHRGIKKEELAITVCFMATFRISGTKVWTHILKEIKVSNDLESVRILCELFEKKFNFSKAFYSEISQTTACWNELLEIFFIHKKYAFFTEYFIHFFKDIKDYKDSFEGSKQKILNSIVKTILMGSIEAVKENPGIALSETDVLNMVRISKSMEMQDIILGILIPLSSLASKKGNHPKLFRWSVTALFAIFNEVGATPFSQEAIESIGRLITFFPQHINDPKYAKDPKWQKITVFMHLLVKLFTELCEPSPRYFSQAESLLGLHCQSASHQSSDLFCKISESLQKTASPKTVQEIKKQKIHALNCLFIYLQTPHEPNILKHLQFLHSSNFKNAVTPLEFIQVAEVALRGISFAGEMNMHVFIKTLFEVYNDYLSYSPEKISAISAGILSNINLQECKNSGDDKLFLHTHKMMFSKLISRPLNKYLEENLSEDLDPNSDLSTNSPIHPLMMLMCDLMAYHNRNPQAEGYNTIRGNLRQLLDCPSISAESRIKLFTLFIYEVRFSQGGEFNAHMNTCRKLYSQSESLKNYKDLPLTSSAIHLILHEEFPKSRECALSERDKRNVFRLVLNFMTKKCSEEMIFRLMGLVEQNHELLLTNNGEILFAALEKLQDFFEQKESCSHEFTIRFVQRLKQLLFECSSLIMEKLAHLDQQRTEGWLLKMPKIMETQAKKLPFNRMYSCQVFHTMLDFCTPFLKSKLFGHPEVKLDLISTILELSKLPYHHLKEFELFDPVYEVLLSTDYSDAELDAHHIDEKIFKTEQLMLLQECLKDFIGLSKVPLHQVKITKMIPKIQVYLRKYTHDCFKELLSKTALQIEVLELSIKQNQSKVSKVKK